MKSYAARLFRIEDDGAVKLVSDLVPKFPGGYWINISYDLRKAVIETGYPEGAIIVVDSIRQRRLRSVIAPIPAAGAALENNGWPMPLVMVRHSSG